MEYVKAEAKLVYLLECLQKTAPPVLVFAEKTSDVDDIHEYLLVKGVEAVAVHGGKDQEDREAAIDAFKVWHGAWHARVLKCLSSWWYIRDFCVAWEPPSWHSFATLLRGMGIMQLRC